MDGITHIYGLIDPRTQELRYVGKTDTLRRRLWFHKFEARRGNCTHKARWIRGLLLASLTPEMILIETVPRAEWPEAERFWIAYFRSIGCPLTNQCAGGRGMMDLSAESRAKISAAMRGRTISQATIAAVTARNRDPDYWTPERRQAASHAAKRRIARDGPPKGRSGPISETERLARMEASKHRVYSDETRRKLSAATQRRDHAKAALKFRKRYIATDPTGTEHKVEGLRSFCREHGLDASTMTNIANGKRGMTVHKGWTCRHMA